jgi:hypothetical protein
MKKQLLILALLLGVYAGALAQTEKGNLMAGGSGYFRVQRNPFHSVYSNVDYVAELSPRVGYFVHDNISMGAILPLAYNKTAGGPVNAFGVGINPFARAYIGSRAIRPLLEARTGYNLSNSRFSYYAGETTRKLYYANLGLGTGLVWFINKNIGLELLAGYDWLPGMGVRPVTLRDGYSVNLGIQTYINRQR